MGIAVRGGSMALSSANAVARLVKGQKDLALEVNGMAGVLNTFMQKLDADNRALQAANMQLTTDLATQKSLVEVERGAAQMYREEGKRLHKVAQVSAGKAELAAVEFTTIKNDLNSEVGTLKRKIASLDESLGIAEKAQDELQEKYTKLKRRMKKKGVRMESTDDELEAAMNAPEADDYDDDM